MTSQIEILKFFTDRHIYEKYSNCIKEYNFISPNDWMLFQEFEIYFEAFPSKKQLEINEFTEWFFHLRKPDLNNDIRDDIKVILDKLKEPLSSEFSEEAIKKFKEVSCCLTIHELITKGTFDLHLIKKEIEKIEEDQVIDLIKATKVNGDFDHVMDLSDPKTGYKWPLKCLNSNLPYLQKGIYCIVGSRTNAGKSSFVAQIVAHNLEEITKENPVLWFNSEGRGEKVCHLRVFQALMKKRFDELNKDRLSIKKQIESLGIYDKLHCHQMTDLSKKDIESIIKYYNPSLVIIDMIDDISYSKQSSKDGRTDDLRNLATWGLKICENFPLIVTSQLSAEAEGKSQHGYNPENHMWPGMSCLEGSKTGKPSKANVILTIGMNNQFPKSRYIECPKNKFGVEGGLKHEVKLDRERSIFYE